jgi:hypothetical protein
MDALRLRKNARQIKPEESFKIPYRGDADEEEPTQGVQNSERHALFALPGCWHGNELVER